MPRRGGIPPTEWLLFSQGVNRHRDDRAEPTNACSKRWFIAFEHHIPVACGIAPAVTFSAGVTTRWLYFISDTANETFVRPAPF